MYQFLIRPNGIGSWIALEKSIPIFTIRPIGTILLPDSQLPTNSNFNIYRVFYSYHLHYCIPKEIVLRDLKKKCYCIYNY